MGLAELARLSRLFARIVSAYRGSTVLEQMLWLYSGASVAGTVAVEARIVCS